MENVANGAQPNALKALRASLVGAFLEREAITESLLQALIAGEHAVLIGPPGTAKSALIRAIAEAIRMSYWEYLLSRFTTPEEIAGPLKITGLQKDQYERVLTGRMCDVQIAFLDETFKGNSAILNSLLTIMNERIFHNGAGAPVKLPLVSVFGASNELPESEELSAMYDRFMIRVWVPYIEDDMNFLKLLEGGGTPKIAPVSIDIPAEQAAAKAVTIPSDVLEALKNIRSTMKKEGLVPSDRRFVKSLKIVRAAAHLDGRTTAEPEDLECLENVLWQQPSEQKTVVRLIRTTVSPNAAKALEYLDAAKDARKRLPANTDKAFLSSAIDCLATLKDLGTKLKELGKGRKIQEARTEVIKMHKEISSLSAAAFGHGIAS